MPCRRVASPFPFIDFSSYQMHRKIALIDGQTHHQAGGDDRHFPDASHILRLTAESAVK
ncbi:Uncharacterised protein [Shigella sonnei]|nr:Uncharacterised protein [Shigella sonnei]